MYPVLVERFLGPTGLMRKLALPKPQASRFVIISKSQEYVYATTTTTATKINK